MSTKTERANLETMFFNLIYDMDCIGGETEILEGLSKMSDAELKAAIDDYLKTE